VNSKSSATQTIEAEARSAAQALGLRVEVLVASTEDEIDAAFGAAVQRGAGALLVGGDAYFNSRRAQFIALAARHGLPTNFDRREIAMADKPRRQRAGGPHSGPAAAADRRASNPGMTCQGCRPATHRLLDKRALVSATSDLAQQNSNPGVTPLRFLGVNGIPIRAARTPASTAGG
jgi:hypothetical protein